MDRPRKGCLPVGTGTGVIVGDLALVFPLPCTPQGAPGLASQWSPHRVPRRAPRPKMAQPLSSTRTAQHDLGPRILEPGGVGRSSSWNNAISDLGIAWALALRGPFATDKGLSVSFLEKEGRSPPMTFGPDAVGDRGSVSRVTHTQLHHQHEGIPCYNHMPTCLNDIECTCFSLSSTPLSTPIRGPGAQSVDLDREPLVECGIRTASRKPVSVIHWLLTA